MANSPVTACATNDPEQNSITTLTNAPLVDHKQKSPPTIPPRKRVERASGERRIAVSRDAYVAAPNRCGKHPFPPSRTQIAITFIASFVAVYALETAALAVIGWAR
jgi:hypothetical protein